MVCKGWLCLLYLSECVHLPGARGPCGDGAGCRRDELGAGAAACLVLSLFASRGGLEMLILSTSHLYVSLGWGTCSSHSCAASAAAGSTGLGQQGSPAPAQPRHQLPALCERGWRSYVNLHSPASSLLYAKPSPYMGMATFGANTAYFDGELHT